METIKFKSLSKNFRLPSYATEGSANFDLKADFDSQINGNAIFIKENNESGMSELRTLDSYYLRPGVIAVIPLGFAIELPKDKKLEIYSRSGMAIKGLVVNNAPGQVDSDYRGCVCVIVKNVGPEALKISNGDRICQGAIVDVIKSDFELVEELTETDRGEGGFGHTGK
jgi:dUTP pyrophosphatase